MDTLGRFGMREQGASGIYAHDPRSGCGQCSADDALTAPHIKNINTRKVVRQGTQQQIREN
jgi:hypothetical protein